MSNITTPPSSYYDPPEDPTGDALVEHIEVAVHEASDFCDEFNKHHRATTGIFEEPLDDFSDPDEFDGERAAFTFYLAVRHKLGDGFAGVELASSLRELADRIEKFDREGGAA